MREVWGDIEHHAAAGETAAILAIRPGVPRLERAEHSAWQESLEAKGPRHWKALFPHGATGVDPKKATAQTGERLLHAATERFVRELEQWDPLTPR
jgi:creatinine amidohydrolase/Fe(II)-dependent formamide hydrolase-like protein